MSFRPSASFITLTRCARLGIKQPPTRWDDLGEPEYFHEIALANPTQSSSVNKSFEMLIQQQMQFALWKHGVREWRIVFSRPGDGGRARGLDQAMRLLMRIGANARYFTDASTKIALDVGAGEAAAGMTIDFYGRFQSESVAKPDGSSHVQYVNAAGGTSVGVDPIGLFRGAPNADVAREFIAFVMSPEGQKLWNWKVGTPGGPERYALRRLPVLPQLYAPEFKALRSDPEVNPYELAKTFTYHEKWTAPLFRTYRVHLSRDVHRHARRTDRSVARLDRGEVPARSAGCVRGGQAGRSYRGRWAHP